MNHDIIVTAASKYDNEHYGITHKSAYVYRSRKGHYPVRVVVWDNTGRPNPRDGEPVRYGEMGPRDGGNGKYLSPHNNATDDPVTILLTPESTVITSNGTNTGTVASGQVYAPDQAAKLADEDTATLWFTDSERTQAVILHFPPHHNGHGYATESPSV